jgi:glutathione peroxidase
MKKSALLLAALCILNLTAKSRLYRITVSDANNQPVSMADYKGQVLLIVNTATRCGFTPQYNELEALYEKYAPQGFCILDFPCNQFGAQAPGSNAEIHQFCTANFHIQFPQFDKIDVNGPNASPLFTYLKRKAPFCGFNLNDETGKFMHQMLLKQDTEYAQKADIKWNFTKFLINRHGKVVARFEPTAKMKEIEEVLQKLL